MLEGKVSGSQYTKLPFGPVVVRLLQSPVEERVKTLEATEAVTLPSATQPSSAEEELNVLL